MLVPSATAFAQTITESETTYISEHAETEIQTNIIETNSEEAAIIVEEPEETTSAHETNSLQTCKSVWILLLTRGYLNG